MSPEQITVEQQEEWLEEPPESELPPRPRRRLLTPIPLALMGVLAIACGFIGGVPLRRAKTLQAHRVAVLQLLRRALPLYARVRQELLGLRAPARAPAPVRRPVLLVAEPVPPASNARLPVPSPTSTAARCT